MTRIQVSEPLLSCSHFAAVCGVSKEVSRVECYHRCIARLASHYASLRNDGVHFEWPWNNVQIERPVDHFTPIQDYTPFQKNIIQSTNQNRALAMLTLQAQNESLMFTEQVIFFDNNQQLLSRPHAVVSFNDLKFYKGTLEKDMKARSIERAVVHIKPCYYKTRGPFDTVPLDLWVECQGHIQMANVQCLYLYVWTKQYGNALWLIERDDHRWKYLLKKHIRPFIDKLIHLEIPKKWKPGKLQLVNTKIEKSRDSSCTLIEKI